jgi:hypothetical protein
MSHRGPAPLVGLKEEVVVLTDPSPDLDLDLALCLELHLAVLATWVEGDQRRKDGREPSAGLSLVTGELTEEIIDTVQITVIIELDPVPAVIPLAHLVLEDTERGFRPPHPAVARDHPHPKLCAKGEIILRRDLGLDQCRACVPIPVQALGSRAARLTGEEDLRLLIQELIDENYALMLARAANPEITVD